ncbi:serine hydrolase [Pedobacter punctiformis]|uniref:Serine hydrolase n=1 Tax=Pedobacter punctiformis TaxID=3004097 RepID=A0ABT4LBA1_9SPHI|nr:serine hydrolase [Pedobacter sp. HCMS5-2]MCZ4245179.1 serine hydrolase [Pedobacter sp. HCMS5-2]
MYSRHSLKINLFFALIAFSISGLKAQVLTSKQIDSISEKVLTTFDVPGLAVAIVKDGKVIHAKGYGVRSLKSAQKVDENTLFGIASNTKAFTAAGLAILIDEKKLTWDTKVTDVIPEFKMFDPYVTAEFTIRDLLSHRSGLGLGAGDLMIWPDSSTVSKKQIIHNLRYLKPVSSFRTKWDYDNLLYIVAGEVIERVGGMKYEDFIETRIMQPLGMTKSALSFNRLKDKTNIIDAHAPVNGKITAIPKDFTENSNAAGGINTSVNDLSKWVITQLNGGKYGEKLDKTLFSRSAQNQMWTLHSIIPAGKGLYNRHFFGYGLGWFLSDEKGNLVAEHTGGLAGMVSEVTLIPEMKLGIIVLTNQQAGGAFSAITQSIKDGYYGVTGKDRITEQVQNVKAEVDYAKKVTDKIWGDIAAEQKNVTNKVETKKYSGTYSDIWFGEAIISEQNGKMHFQAKNSPKLKGDMVYYKGNTFIVKWYDRSLDADAFVNFSLDNDAIPNGFKMEAISPLTDFSFDFQDLDFKKNDQK